MTVPLSQFKREQTGELDMIDQKIREHTIKPKTLRERRGKRDSNFFLVDSRHLNLITFRKLNVGWTEEFCKHTDELAREDHSYIATSSERSRHAEAWTSSLNSHRNTTAPIQSRADFPQALAKLCAMKKEAAESGPILLPSFDMIFKSDRINGNNCSDMNFPQVTPQQVHPINIHQAR